ncbi:MAG: nickel-binding protein [Motiliproteus sp.]
MFDIFIERDFSPPLSREHVFAMTNESAGCFGLYKVSWCESFLALDGSRMICHFRAPDTESVRIAFRQTGSGDADLWPGTVHLAPDPTPMEPNVVVERHFEQPVTLQSIQKIEDAGSWCLETHQVKFVRTYFSRQRTRMICLYHAPDAEAVRLAQRKAEMPVDRVWAFQRLSPEDMASSG